MKFFGAGLGTEPYAAVKFPDSARNWRTKPASPRKSSASPLKPSSPVKSPKSPVDVDLWEKGSTMIGSPGSDASEDFVEEVYRSPKQTPKQKTPESRSYLKNSHSSRYSDDNEMPTMPTRQSRSPRRSDKHRSAKHRHGDTVSKYPSSYASSYTSSYTMPPEPVHVPPPQQHHNKGNNMREYVEVKGLKRGLTTTKVKSKHPVWYPSKNTKYGGRKKRKNRTKKRR